MQAEREGHPAPSGRWGWGAAGGAKLFWFLRAFAAGELSIIRTSPALPHLLGSNQGLSGVSWGHTLLCRVWGPEWRGTDQTEGRHLVLQLRSRFGRITDGAYQPPRVSSLFDSFFPKMEVCV